MKCNQLVNYMLKENIKCACWVYTISAFCSWNYVRRQFVGKQGMSFLAIICCHNPICWGKIHFMGRQRVCRHVHWWHIKIPTRNTLLKSSCHFEFIAFLLAFTSHFSVRHYVNSRWVYFTVFVRGKIQTSKQDTRKHILKYDQILQ